MDWGQFLCVWVRFLCVCVFCVFGIFAARCYASAACAIIRCLCVCLFVSVSVTFVHFVKMNKDILEIFSPSGSQAILVFLHQTAWQYSDGGVGRNRDSKLQQARCCQYDATEPP